MRPVQKSDVYLIIFQVWIMGAMGFKDGVMIALGVFFFVLAMIHSWKGD